MKRWRCYQITQLNIMGIRGVMVTRQTPNLKAKGSSPFGCAMQS